MRARRGGPDQFHEWVREAYLEIPKRLRRRIANVAVVVEDEPSADELRRARCPRDATLLGLYHGIPLTQRTSSYGMVLPDRISIYRGPIERLARDEKDAQRIVKETLWHEVGHYFGMDEQQVRRAEQRWRKKVRSSEFKVES